MRADQPGAVTVERPISCRGAIGPESGAGGISPLAGLAWPGRGRLSAFLRRLHLTLFYAATHRRWANLDEPRRFTEWVQWRKLHDDSAELARLTDKLHAKDLVTRRCGADACVPVLWSGTVLPPEPPPPLPVMVKANHGCGQYRLVLSKGDWDRARGATRRWLRGPYGQWLGERQYRSARRLILVEPFIGSANGRLPDDYKVYVFGGRAVAIQHHVGRGTRLHRWTQFDRSWRRIGGAPSSASAPATLEAMFEMAERAAGGADYLRVDLYEVDGRAMFGEFCLFPGSGLDPFDPIELDIWFGNFWSAARRNTSGRSP